MQQAYKSYSAESNKAILYPFYGSENLERIDVISHETGDETTYYTSVNGVLYNKDLTSIVFFPPAYKGESYTILSSVNKIENGAFAYSQKPI
ncbi:MAG: hypothetical protein NC177_16260 [Ruminococcus flavefaciens]|nr:hypothetical protein [Ruminococcus flavefaciens]